MEPETEAVVCTSTLGSRGFKFRDLGFGFSEARFAFRGFTFRISGFGVSALEPRGFRLKAVVGMQALTPNPETPKPQTLGRMRVQRLLV